MKKVLFIAPHPDDESFGCGGTILKHKNSNDQIYWLIVTTGNTEEGFTSDSLLQMEKQIEKVNKFYAFNDYFRLQFHSTRLDNYPVGEIIFQINSYINKIKPDTIYVNHKNDVHTDHGVVFDAVWSCCKSFRNPFITSVYAYETLSETELSNPDSKSTFHPNTFVDISNYIEEKKNAISIYESELEEHPMPRSLVNVESLARIRGSMVKVEYAESFICLKQVI